MALKSVLLPTFGRPTTVSYTHLVVNESNVAVLGAGILLAVGIKIKNVVVLSEGKEYVMNDGDVVLFRFNV